MENKKPFSLRVVLERQGRHGMWHAVWDNSMLCTPWFSALDDRTNPAKRAVVALEFFLSDNREALIQLFFDANRAVPSQRSSIATPMGILNTGWPSDRSSLSLSLWNDQKDQGKRGYASLADLSLTKEEAHRASPFAETQKQVSVLLALLCGQLDTVGHALDAGSGLFEGAVLLCPPPCTGLAADLSFNAKTSHTRMEARAAWQSLKTWTPKTTRMLVAYSA